MTCTRKIGPFACCSVVQGDCLELMRELPDGCVDAVITDPPYPDYFTDLYRYNAGTLELVSASFKCRQFIFWSARADFPMDCSAVHIWNKNPSNHGAQYERVFERNGGEHCKVWTHYMVNSTLAAILTHDEFYEHPSQKPIHLMLEIVRMTTGTILDPFCGSGTTLVAAAKLGRHFLGFEISPEYCEIARKRLALVEAQPTLFEKKPEQLTL